MTNVVFFDSWGGAWATCSPDNPNAVAFGPTGVSRPLNRGEFNLLTGCEVVGSETPWRAAANEGLSEPILVD